MFPAPVCGTDDNHEWPPVLRDKLRNPFSRALSYSRKTLLGCLELANCHGLIVPYSVLSVQNFWCWWRLRCGSSDESSKKLRSTHNPRLDLFHRFAQGGITEVALGDLEECGAGPAGLEELEIFDG
jgi:hypothetical protein